MNDNKFLILSKGEKSFLPDIYKWSNSVREQRVNHPDRCSYNFH